MKLLPSKSNFKYSLQLEEFHPNGGYEKFLKDFCNSIGEKLVEWWQGVEAGIGCITFRGDSVQVYWSDFPDAFFFDCNDLSQAQMIEIVLRNYLGQQKFH